MTIISSVQEPSEFDFPLEGIPNEEKPLELKAYPPVDDVIDFIKGIDWHDLGIRFRTGTGNLLQFAMKLSEWSYEFHNHLYDRYCSYTKDPTTK